MKLRATEIQWCFKAQARLIPMQKPIRDKIRKTDRKIKIFSIHKIKIKMQPYYLQLHYLHISWKFVSVATKKIIQWIYCVWVRIKRNNAFRPQLNNYLLWLIFCVQSGSATVTSVWVWCVTKRLQTKQINLLV